MSLSQLGLGLLLILWAVSGLGWVSVPATLLLWLALITGILLLLEALGVLVWHTPVLIRRNNP